MTFRPSRPLTIALGLALAFAANAQEPAPPPTPAPTPTAVATPAPAGQPDATAPSAPPAAPAAVPPAIVPPPPTPTPQRITDSSVVAILQAPADNPFGHVPEIPAALPPKMTFTDAVVTGSRFVSVRVDATGRPMGSRAERDPIPSLNAEAQKSLARWTFDPARRGGQPVETWAALKLDLEAEIDSPRNVQATLNPVTPATPLPKPFLWPADDAWLESRTAPPGTDGTTSLESVDAPPMPKKTPWDADSYRGPFSARFWVKLNSNGTVEKAIPLEVSDPILLGYLRRSLTWPFKPARVGGGSAESWNELNLSGQVSYKVEIKQITSLRKSLAGS